MKNITKNEKHQTIGTFSSNQNKIKNFSILSYKNKNSFNENLKTNKNIVHTPFPELKEFYSKTTNIVGLRLPDYELINLKRKEAPHVFSTRYKYIDENRKRLFSKKIYSQENKESLKLQNTFLSNFRHNRTNLDNYLKFEKTKYVSVPLEESENYNNCNKLKNGINDLNENKLSEKIMKSKNNTKLRNNILLPRNLEYKRKNYMELSGDGNFMEKYEYYLLNLNKNNSQNRQIIRRENNSLNNYYNNNVKSRNYTTNYNNYFNVSNIQQIKPYKYNKFYLNIERNNLKKENLTDRVSTISTNNKYLFKYLDDSYIKKLKSSNVINNNNNINKSKTMNSFDNKIIYLSSNYFDETINQLKRRVLCINEKNEDLVLGKAISLLRKENETINNEVDKNMNMLCKIKNFSLTQGNEQLIPLINKILLNKKYQKNDEYKKNEQLEETNKKNKNKVDILNKELKVFDLEKNYKYADEDREGGFGNIYYNIVSRKNDKKRRFLKRFNRSVIPVNHKKKFYFYKVEKLKRYKSFDNKDNSDDDDSYYIPSRYNNKKIKIARPPIDNHNSNENNNNNNEKVNNPVQKIIPKLHFNYIGSIPNLLNNNIINTNPQTKKANFQTVANRSYKKRIFNKNENNYKKNNNNLNLRITRMKIDNKSNDVIEKVKIKENNRENLETQMTENETINKETIKNIIFDEEKEKGKINDLKIHELLIKENQENIAKNYISHSKFIRKNNLKTKSIYYKLKPRLDKISYFVYDYNPAKNNDEEINEEKGKKIGGGRKNHLTIIFRNPPKDVMKKKKSKFLKKKNKSKNKNNSKVKILYYEPPKTDMNDYAKLLNILKAEEESRKKINENKKVLFSNISPNRAKRRISRLYTMNKSPNNDKKANYSTQKTFKDFKEESVDEDGLIDYKKFHEEEKKFKKRSNLNKFKNQISKMKNMSVNEYINYMENYFSPKNHNENNNNGQERINKFLDSMRKNIEKFRGKQNILQINCQPIDYIITIGNGFGNYFIDTKEVKSQRNESFKNDLNSSNN